MRRCWRSAGFVAFALAIGPIACGGGGGGGTPSSPSPTTPATPQNRCSAALSAPAEAEPADLAAPRSAKAPARPLDADPRGTIFDVLWDHRAAVGRGALVPLEFTTPAAAADVGDIAVLQDEGDLIAQANAFDLAQTGLRATPNASGGYDIVRIDATFRAEIGSRVTLGDDDSSQQAVPFNFRFFGQAQTAAFVNSDGNITFGEADRSSSERNVARLLTGAPRVAPFLADLDPSSGGGVFIRAAADAFTATWCGVPVFGSRLQATLQTSLLPDGTVVMKYGASSAFTATDGVVGVSPGRTGAFLPVDLSTATPGGPVAGGGSAIGERFSERSTLDLVAVGRKFYTTHADVPDQLVVWTDTTLTFGAFSFEVTVANEIAGIGIGRYDTSSEFGSRNRLRSMVQMDNIGKFPEDPSVKFLGENNTLSVLGQEVGHRWLAFLRFSDHNRQVSDALLGRDQAHWSFFFNSDASVMEGNRIQDLGGGSFRTVAAVEKYSLLDQYAMGLVRDIDVPSFFYVDSPTNTQATEATAPRVGVTFNGTRRDVLINQVIEVMGQRVPSAADSPKLLRQAFVFVVGRGRTADPAVVAKIDRIRRNWEPFFNTATDGRGRADTRLVPSTSTVTRR